MNAPITTLMPDHPEHPLQQRARELDAGWLRRVREASLHQLGVIERAHKANGCEDLCGECWKCAAIARQRGGR